MDRVEDYELEPSVARIVALAKRRGEPDRSVPWPRRRQDAAMFARRFRRVLIPDGPPMHSELDLSVAVEGGRIHVRVYRPRSGTLPVHLFLHGGGWCTGTLDERDPRCRQIAHGADCLVVSADYRMAPENAFPVPVEDSYRVLEWIADGANGDDIDASRISVGGESAGANLAAAVALLARDRSGPALRHQWLDVPATDLTMEQPSVSATPDGFGLTYADMVDYRDAYCPDPADWHRPEASPLHAPDLSGLPPAWVTTCGADPLRDDGRAYVRGLRAAGVAVEHRHLSGHIHASFAFTRLASSADHERQAIAALRQAFRG